MCHRGMLAIHFPSSLRCQTCQSPDAPHPRCAVPPTLLQLQALFTCIACSLARALHVASGTTQHTARPGGRARHVCTGLSSRAHEVENSTCHFCRTFGNGATSRCARAQQRFSVRLHSRFSSIQFHAFVWLRGQEDQVWRRSAKRGGSSRLFALRAMRALARAPRPPARALPAAGVRSIDARRCAPALQYLAAERTARPARAACIALRTLQPRATS